jgi:hypothetical protein
MRTRSVLAVMAMGISLWSCSEEKPGVGVGPDTSWQVYCAPDDPEMNCSISEQAHGPLDGPDKDDKDDDYKLEVSCRKLTSGFSITIEDPGAKANVETQMRARARSVLSIERADGDDNKCVISVNEYPTSGGQRRFIDACAGNSTNPGTCTLEGGEGDGYAFSGTLICEGLRINNAGPAAYVLRGAGEPDEPMVLQIANCD